MPTFSRSCENRRERRARSPEVSACRPTLAGTLVGQGRLLERRQVSACRPKLRFKKLMPLSWARFATFCSTGLERRENFSFMCFRNPYQVYTIISSNFKISLRYEERIICACMYILDEVVRYQLRNETSCDVSLGSFERFVGRSDMIGLLLMI